jgi:predicted SprT family Zn-dependent metalloprotease
MGFDDICKLRLRGYSFQCILDGLVEAGFFDEDADVKYLCQAFSRERKKREDASDKDEAYFCESCGRNLGFNTEI